MEMKQPINVFKLSCDGAEDNSLCNEYLCNVFCKVSIFGIYFKKCIYLENK